MAADSVESDEKRAKQKDLWDRALQDRQMARFDDAEQVGRLVVQAMYNHRVLAETPKEQSGKLLYDSQHVHKSTTLLFSYVTNQAGFDTGLVVVNASAAPFGSQPQAGLLTIHYFGSCTGGAPAPPRQISSVVPPGQHAVWTLSSGGTVVTRGGTIAAAPGFQGYVIVECDFPDAHGIAYIAPIATMMTSGGAAYHAKVISAARPRDEGGE